MTMAAACYPDAQARVQSQLDEVVGYDRGEHRARCICLHLSCDLRSACSPNVRGREYASGSHCVHP